jgi:hypothetical protein
MKLIAITITAMGDFASDAQQFNWAKGDPIEHVEAAANKLMEYVREERAKALPDGRALTPMPLVEILPPSIT